MNINLRERNKETSQTKVHALQTALQSHASCTCVLMSLHSHACIAAVTVKHSLCLLRYDDQSQNDHEKQGAEDQQGHRGKVRS